MDDEYGGGKILDSGDLPFHLCSVQIFFIFFIYRTCLKSEIQKWIKKTEKAQNKEKDKEHILKGL